MVASVGISQVVMNGSSSEVATEEILVASVNIPANAKISAQNIKREKWPVGKAPEGKITSLEEIEDKYAKQQIYAGEPLLKQKVVDATARASFGIPQGHTLVQYNIANVPGFANLIEVGDRVNVIGFFETSDVVPETSHRDVFRNIPIYAIDGRTTRDVDGTAGTPNWVSLLIRKEDEKVWNTASKLASGPLELTLGNPNEPLDSESPNEAAQEFNGWLEAFAELRRKQQIRVETPIQEEPQEQQPGGKLITVLTPDGHRLYRWNETNRTMELIEQTSPLDTRLGDSPDAQDDAASQRDEAYEEELDVDPRTPQPAFRLNRAR